MMISYESRWPNGIQWYQPRDASLSAMGLKNILHFGGKNWHGNFHRGFLDLSLQDICLKMGSMGTHKSPLYRHRPTHFMIITCSFVQKTFFTCSFHNGVFEYFCILGSLYSLGIALIGLECKAETLVDPMSSVVLMCDDVSPHSSHFIVRPCFETWHQCIKLDVVTSRIITASWNCSTTN